MKKDTDTNERSTASDHENRSVKRSLSGASDSDGLYYGSSWGVVEQLERDECESAASDPTLGADSVTYSVRVNGFDDDGRFPVEDGHEHTTVMHPALLGKPSIEASQLTPYCIRGQNSAVLAIPFHAPAGYQGGVHVVTPHAIVDLWCRLTVEELVKEYNHRRANDLGVPVYLDVMLGHDRGRDNAY